MAGKKAKLPDGRVVPINPKGREICTTEHWYTKIDGRVISLGPDRDTAREMETRMRLDGMLVRRGLASQIAPVEGTDLPGLIDRWLEELEARGRTPGDRATIRTRVELLTRLGLRTLVDLAKPGAGEVIERGVAALGKGTGAPELPADELFTPAQARHFLEVSPSGLSKLCRSRGVAGQGKGKKRRFTRAEMAVLASHKGKGLSGTTMGHYSAAITSFARWLTRRGLLQNPPYIARKRVTTEDRPRRTITWSQCVALAKATASEKRTRGGLTARSRSVLWRVAFCTMLRARALRGLVVGDLRLEAANPHIWVRAEIDKCRKSRAVPVEPDTAKDLAKLVARRGPKDPVWEFPSQIGPTLRADLRGAGIEPRTADGVIDLHSFRHSGASHLMAKGVSPLLICKAGGWSDTRMLLSRYGHLAADGLEAFKGVF
jgi:integrase